MGGADEVTSRDEHCLVWGRTSARRWFTRRRDSHASWTAPELCVGGANIEGGYIIGYCCNH